jgi:hypothetical protein
MRSGTVGAAIDSPRAMQWLSAEAGDLENLVDAQPGACLGLAGDGQGGEHDGQVSLDRCER